MSKQKKNILVSANIDLVIIMDIYYRNEILFVDITNDLNLDMVEVLKRRIFRILDDYGIDKIVISVNGFCDRKAINDFKKEYYHKYRGYLLIK
jgi:hypothetical protein